MRSLGLGKSQRELLNSSVIIQASITVEAITMLHQLFAILVLVLCLLIFKPVYVMSKPACRTLRTEVFISLVIIEEVPAWSVLVLAAFMCTHIMAVIAVLAPSASSFQEIEANVDGIVAHIRLSILRSLSTCDFNLLFFRQLCNLLSIYFSLRNFFRDLNHELLDLRFFIRNREIFVSPVKLHPIG